VTDDNNPNPWDAFLPMLVLVLSACVSVLLLVSTYVLARWLMGLV